MAKKTISSDDTLEKNSLNEELDRVKTKWGGTVAVWSAGLLFGILISIIAYKMWSDPTKATDLSDLQTWVTTTLSVIIGAAASYTWGNNQNK